MKTISLKLNLLMLLSGLLLTITTQAQYLDGGNLDFHTNSYGGWTAKEGIYNSPEYSSTSPIYHWNTTYNDPSTATDVGGHLFEIYSDVNAIDSRTTGIHALKKIPTGYTHSSLINNSYGQTNCSMLQYKMLVDMSNSLLTLNYAMVLEAPGHEGYQNPTFQVDVINSSGNLVDPCAKFEKVGQNSNVTAEPTVWFSDGSSYDAWVWCKWQQIKLSLARYIGDTVTLRVRLGDCCYTAHGGYGYIVAKAEEPLINVAGCAATGDVVATAYAPTGFASYKWFEISTLTSSQSDLESFCNAATALSTTDSLVVTRAMMNGNVTKYYAVEVTSPTMGNTSSCKAYISCTVNDTRPNLDNATYIPTDPENPYDEIGFKFSEVQPSAQSYFLGLQKFDFADGDSAVFNFHQYNNTWTADASTLTPRTRIVYTNNTVDTVYHRYEHNCRVYPVERCAQTSDSSDYPNCMKCKTIDVNVPSRPTLYFIARDTICYGTDDTITAISPVDTSNTNCTTDTTKYKYEWWHENQAYTETPFFVGKQYIATDVTQTTVFKVRVTDTATNFYRYNTDTVFVQAFPDITLTGDTVICLGNQANISATDATGETVAMQWSFTQPTNPVVITSPSTNPVLTFTPTRDTTVYLIAQTSQGCVAWKSIRLYITNPVVTADKTKICPGETVTLTGSQAVDYSFTAVPTDASLTENVRSADPVVVSPTQTTTYTMRGYGTSGCYSERQITIKVIPYPIATISYSPEYVDVEEPTLSIKDDSPNGVSSLWTFSDGGTSTARTVNYKFNNVSVDSVWINLISSNELGCSDTAKVTVPVELFAVWIPNAFTPNGDGSNDYFFFMTANKLTDVTFQIFNRWGEKIFERTFDELDPSQINNMTTSLGWNGKYKDEYAKNGTYVWRLTYKRSGNTRVYDRKGTVNLIR